jgi:hypothetical protein
MSVLLSEAFNSGGSNNKCLSHKIAFEFYLL